MGTGLKSGWPVAGSFERWIVQWIVSFWFGVYYFSWLLEKLGGLGLGLGRVLLSLVLVACKACCSAGQVVH